MTTNHRCFARTDRREFLSELGAVVGAGALAGPALASGLNADAGRNAAGIPLRPLGRTREKVTILGLGCAPVGHSMPGAAAAAGCKPAIQWIGNLRHACRLRRTREVRRSNHSF